MEKYYRESLSSSFRGVTPLRQKPLPNFILTAVKTERFKRSLIYLEMTLSICLPL